MALTQQTNGSVQLEASVAETVLLLSTYEMGHQPFNLASPLAMLEENGISTRVIDTSITPVNRQTIELAWFIAISIPMHTATRLALPLIDQIRKIKPEVHICCYGLYATLNSDFLLERGVDFIIGGEYEVPLKKLVRALQSGQPTIISGVTTAQGASEPYLKKIPFVPLKRSTLPDLKHYAHLEQNGRKSLAGYVEASRGCLHTCLHCPVTPVYNSRFFVVPQEVVLADISTQVEMGATHITFGDPDFLNGPGHSLKIVRAMHEIFPQLTFDITVKIEHILKYPNHLAELQNLGCLFVVSAVESFSDVILEKLDKGHTRSDIYEALEILRAVDLPLRPSLLAFTPWTTLADYLDLLEQIESLQLVEQLDPVQYSIRLLVPPHSALLQQADINEWLGPLDAPNLAYQWHHSDPRMDSLYHAVSSLVALAAEAGEDTRTTFYRLKALAYAVALGRPLDEASHPELPEQTSSFTTSAKLTENWFC